MCLDVSFTFCCLKNSRLRVILRRAISNNIRPTRKNHFSDDFALILLLDQQFLKCVLQDRNK